MEIISIAGYTHKEKRHILDSYLYPDAIVKAGLSSKIAKIEFPAKLRDSVIESYAREPGVRSLKKHINRICEKIAFKVVESTMWISKKGQNSNKDENGEACEAGIGKNQRHLDQNAWGNKNNNYIVF